MIVQPKRRCEAPGLFIRLRYLVAKFIYDVIFVVLVRDGSWQEGVVTSLAPKADDRILDFARRISGSAAAEPHMNGTWTECLTKGGLAGVRRQSSHSIGIGRISVVKARKR